MESIPDLFAPLADIDRSWLAESLIKGYDKHALAEELINNGRPPVSVYREIDQILEHPYVQGAMRAFQSGERPVFNPEAQTQAQPQPAGETHRSQIPPSDILAQLIKSKTPMDRIVQVMRDTFPEYAPELPLKEMDDGWRKWLKESLGERCFPENLLGILIKNGITLSSIKQAMGDYFPQRSPLLAMYGEYPEPVDHDAFYNVRLTDSKDPRVQRFPNDTLQLYTVENFMSVDECDYIAGLIRQNLTPSDITEKQPGDHYFRTSGTCYLGPSDPHVHEMEQRISQTLGIRPPYTEETQGQHYEVGQQFKGHTDYFDPSTNSYRHYTIDSGNRTWTFMIYLNEVEEGGGTHFSKIGHIFEPRKGMAVVWNNLNRDGSVNLQTFHAGMPVLKGCKTIITKWFRERGCGPAFYSD